MKILKSFIIFTSLFIAPIFFGKGATFSTEVGEYITYNIHQSGHCRMFERGNLCNILNTYIL